MGKVFYRLAIPVLQLCIPRVKERWEEPWDGKPCIFVCNHDRAAGPLQMAVNFSLRQKSKIWIFADPLSRETTPAYVRQDHWWREDAKLAKVYNAVIPPVVSVLLPPILRSVPHVPVYHDARAVKTMKDSLRAMRDEGMNIVIFPEIPTGYGEHDTERINEGFLNIIPMYRKLTGVNPPLRMIHIDTQNHEMLIHRPIFADPERSVKEQTGELSRLILDGIFKK